MADPTFSQSFVSGPMKLALTWQLADITLSHFATRLGEFELKLAPDATLTFSGSPSKVQAAAGLKVLEYHVQLSAGWIFELALAGVLDELQKKGHVGAKAEAAVKDKTGRIEFFLEIETKVNKDAHGPTIEVDQAIGGARVRF